MSNKKYRLLKDIDTPSQFCIKGTVSVCKNGVHFFPCTNSLEPFALSEQFIKQLPKHVFEQWFQEVVEPEPNQPEFPVEEIKALTSMYKDMIAHIRQQKYTEADMDKARRESFGAARELNKASIFPNPVYPTYEDYKKSFKK